MSKFDVWTEVVKRVMSNDKKSRILAAARSVFVIYGYKGVNMNDIALARACRVPRCTFCSRTTQRFSSRLSAEAEFGGLAWGKAPLAGLAFLETDWRGHTDGQGYEFVDVNSSVAARAFGGRSL